MSVDYLGRFLASYELYIEGKISYSDMHRAAEDDRIAIQRILKKVELVAIKTPLRRGQEPETPRDWPTAIVTKWSGKR